MRDFNSLTPGRCGSNFKSAISQHMLQIKCMSTSCKINLKGMPHNILDGKSTMVKVKAWPGTKPLPEPMFTQIYATIWRH